MRAARCLSLALLLLFGCAHPDGRAQDAGSDAATQPPDGAQAARDPTPPSRGENERAYGAPYEGGEFHLGPVDWEETEWHNACASERKYLPAVRAAAGNLLAGVWGGIGAPEAFCDTCIRVDTARGKSAVLRVVTYGETAPNSIDVSPDAYALLDSGEYPRSMSFQLVRCADTGPLMYEFKSGSNGWWAALWVRNARDPIARVEVRGSSHDFMACRREGDGTFVDDSGFGEGPFTVRVVSIDGQVREDSFEWPSGGVAGALLEGARNFD